MTHLEYESLCRDVAEGNDHEIMNEKKHIAGRILLCNREYFDVQVGEGWQVWSREECREVA